MFLLSPACHRPQTEASGSVSWKTKKQTNKQKKKTQKKKKKHDLCVISMENQFSLYPARYYATPRHNPRSDFYLKKKKGLKSSARLEEKKSRSFSAKK